MNVPLSLFHFALPLICAVVPVSAAVVTGSFGYLSLEDHDLDKGVLELFAVSQGVIGIRGVYSNRFLAMNKRGRLHAVEQFTDDCQFRERFQENSYNTYASVMHRNLRTGRNWYVALNKRGKAKMGSSPRVKSQHVSTHFLPRLNVQDLQNQQGFSVTDRTKDRMKSPPQPVPPEAALPGQPKPKPKVDVTTGGKKSQTVKYWPKFRFG